MRHGVVHEKAVLVDCWSKVSMGMNNAPQQRKLTCDVISRPFDCRRIPPRGVLEETVVRVYKPVLAAWNIDGLFTFIQSACCSLPLDTASTSATRWEWGLTIFPLGSRTVLFR